LMVEDNLTVSVYGIQHMLQWGTPDDVEEYRAWSNYFRDICTEYKKREPQPNSLTIIPLSGHGSRFARGGYKDPKPLIEVSGKPMIVQAAASLPSTQNQTFVALKYHLEKYPLKDLLEYEYPNSKIVEIDQVTSGQAITCDIGLNGVDDDASLVVAAADNSMIYDEVKYQNILLDLTVDAIIFTFRNHVSSKTNPEMYGWVKVNENYVASEVSVKVPISSSPGNDHAIVGTFWFRKVGYYRKALASLLEKAIRVNGEYYVDSLMGELIDLGFNVKVLEVNNYVCWGTPNDYETFVYWQSFFHKAVWHPYELAKDTTINQEKINAIERSFIQFGQEST